MIRLGILLAICTNYLSDALTTHHDVYWNSSNPVFEPFDNAIDSPGYYELAAKPLDVIKFHCPRKKANEYSLIFRVSLEEFERCSLGPDAELVATCDGKHHIIHHTLLQDESQPGQLYYITRRNVNLDETEYNPLVVCGCHFSRSTSTGREDGLHNKRLGLCNEKNMRMAVLFDNGDLIQRHDPLLGSEVDLQRLMRDRFYLAEENGELNWKKNVLPDIEFDWRNYLQSHNRRLKFDKSVQIEPIPLDDNFFSRWEQLREMINLRTKTDENVGAWLSISTIAQRYICVSARLKTFHYCSQHVRFVPQNNRLCEPRNNREQNELGFLAQADEEISLLQSDGSCSSLFTATLVGALLFLLQWIR